MCGLLGNHQINARVMFFFLQQIVGNLPTWRKLYCVLRGGKLLCYYAPEEIKAQVEPALAISVNKVKIQSWLY